MTYLLIISNKAALTNNPIIDEYQICGQDDKYFFIVEKKNLPGI